MGYDKAVDSAQLDSALKASADAIRAKKRTSSLIDWSSSEGFKSAIESINIPHCAVGSFIPASDTTTVTVNHNLGVVPTFAFYTAEKQYPTKDGEAYMGYAFTSASNAFENLDLFYGGSSSIRLNIRYPNDENKWGEPMTDPNATGAFRNATDESVTLHNSYPFKAGQKYIYVLVGDAL